MESNELDHSQIIAVEKFAKDLRECFVNYKNDNPDSLSDIMIEYTIQTLDLHLELAKIKFKRWSNNMGLAMAEGVRR